MNNRIWIINYYAVPPRMATMFRHICFAREMAKAGYDVRIFCASAIHNTDIEIDLDGKRFKEVDYDGVRFVHLKTAPYKGNGLRRMIELWRYPRTLKSALGSFDPPAAVIHCAFVPFDLSIARLVKRMGAKYIVEIADLWPASFVAFGLVRPGNPLLRLAYAAERWLYSVADELVFTVEGGKDYIREQGWDGIGRGRISLDKVHGINQGVDLLAFDSAKAGYDAGNVPSGDGRFTVVYVGSIRRANNLAAVIDAAERLQTEGHGRIRFLIYGDGDERESLERRCAERGILNVEFKGRIAPDDVPAVLSRSDLNLFHFGATPLARYGLSPNKLFIYFASGKPILSTVRPAYDLVERYGAGLSVESDAESIAAGILAVEACDQAEYEAFCRGAREAARDYDYPNLAKRIIALLPPTGAHG